MNLVQTLVSMPDQFSTLVTAVTTAGLVETLSSEGPFTVFAPTNEAFEALGEETIQAVLANHAQLTSILTYHVHAGDAVLSTSLSNGQQVSTVEGDPLTISISRRGNHVMINGVATVITADVETTNGVAHVIDTVLMPPTHGHGSGGSGSTMNLVQTLVSMPDQFSTLVTAVTTAGLVETLSSEGPFTVFAPTNEAFEALGEETIQAVLANHAQLTSILTYHVHAGDAVLSTSLSNGQ